jgi:uncharacterized Zn-finger protein
VQYLKRKLEREAGRTGGDSNSNANLLSSSLSLPPPEKKIKLENDVKSIEIKQELSLSLSPVLQPSMTVAAQKRAIVASNHPCRYCDRVFKKTENRDRHEKTHKDFLAYDCGYCYKNFKSEDLLKEHMKIHVQQTKFPCTHNNCNEIFQDRRALREHKATHDPEEYICDVETCGKIFASQKGLKTHKKQAKHFTNDNIDNQETDVIECDICSFKFDRDKLADHLRLHI